MVESLSLCYVVWSTTELLVGNTLINHQESARYKDIFTCVNVLWLILQYLRILWVKRYTWTLLHFLAKHKRERLTLLFTLTEREFTKTNE